MRARQIKIAIALIMCLCLLVACGEKSGSSEQLKSAKLSVSFFDGKKYEGSYSGAAVKDVPNGEGRFTASDGSWSYEGSFSNGAAKGDGTAAGIPFELLGTDAYIGGTYTGPLSGGKMKGKGTASNTRVSLIVSGSLKREGSYTGDLLDGAITGKGLFSTKNDEGMGWHYEGDFKDGMFDGYGVQTFEAEPVQVKAGNYVKGDFVPTAAQLIDAVSYANALGSFKLPDDSAAYMDDHPELFPAADARALEGIPLKEYDYSKLTQDLSSYMGSLVKFDALIVDINVERAFGHTLTTAFIHDGSDLNFGDAIYPASTDAKEGDTVTVYAIPVASTSFTNYMGSTTDAIVFVVSYMEKH